MQCIAVLTDDFKKAFYSLMEKHETSDMVEYRIHDKELITEHTRYIFVTDINKLQALEIQNYVVMIFHPEVHPILMSEMIAFAKTRIRKNNDR